MHWTKINKEGRFLFNKEEKGMTKDEMVGWRHQLNGHEFEQILGASGEQSILAYDAFHGGGKELDMT